MLKAGVKLTKEFLTKTEMTHLKADFDRLAFSKTTGGIRNIDKKSNVVSKLAHSTKLLSTASDYLSGNPSLVRAIYFNKTPNQNWLVTWHQDKTVAVTEKFDRKGWHNWSIKDGTQHVQPPIEVLNDMVTIRLHIDDSNLDSGCLKIYENSHTMGILTQNEIDDYVRKNQPITCIAEKRSAMIMRPHLVHSSSKGLNPTQRRVIHLEYSSYALPQGINWA